MHCVIPESALVLLRKLRAAGYEAYFVGGCVRDLLRGAEPNDYDITTSAMPSEMSSLFNDHRVIETGLQHGTLTVLSGGDSYEITTYRVDGEYTDSRHPDSVTFTRSLREDLARRDFTVNAIAYAPGEPPIDPFGGQADLAARCIRAVGDPRERFREDALRVLRALRFASVLGFSLDPETERAVRTYEGGLPGISAERIRVEIEKLLLGEGAVTILSSHRRFFRSLVPVLSYSDMLWDAVFSHLSSLPAIAHLRLAALFAPAGEQLASDALHALRYDKKMIRRVAQAIAALAHPLPASLRQMLGLLSSFGEETVEDRLLLGREDALALSRAREMLVYALQNKLPYRIADLAVNGETLIASGIPPGRQIGTLLADMLAHVMDGTLENRREDLLAFAGRKEE